MWQRARARLTKDRLLTKTPDKLLISATILARKAAAYRINKASGNLQNQFTIWRNKISRGPEYKNIVIIGCPRSGTTILNLIFKYTVPQCLGWDFEMRAADPYIRQTAKKHPELRVVTKHTDDWREINKIRLLIPGVRFIYIWRDPASNICSKIRGQKDYTIEPETYIEAYKAMKEQQDRDDFIVVKFRDLVTKPNNTQTMLQERLGIDCTVPFSEAWRHIPKVEDPKEKKLTYWNARDEASTKNEERREEFIKQTHHLMAGGIRPFTPETLTEWRKDPANIKRVNEAYEKHPELKTIEEEYSND